MKRVLIANRGEIAVRIIRACRELGIETVAVFSDADVESLHVKLADRAIRIGTGPAANSYLLTDRILDAAKRSEADAIHPGYGLLSENAEFAAAIRHAGITFIGPSPEAMRVMGSKTEARKQMMQTGEVPVVPGSDGPVEGLEAAKAAAKKIGFPVLIKAVAGGGGRGMRVVENEAALKDALESATREALGAFGNGRVYLERYLKNPRHVEIQVFADQAGHCVYLGERECSVQRRHQKIIEESPCVALTPALRERMGQAAVKAANAVRYCGAGTVEFLLDQDHNFYFIEMNTRIQVEHPVTELLFGVDLVRTQLKVAMGENLPWTQDDLKARGAAIECRICAEDPDDGYRPCPGEITGIRFPGGPGVRVDTHIYAGYTIPIFYDPMIAKLIVWGETRDIAIRRMQEALREFQVQGIKTNINQLQAILEHRDFRQGRYHINFLAEQAESLRQPTEKQGPELQEVAAIAAALLEFHKRQVSLETHADAGKQKRNLSAWKLPHQSWKLTGLRRIMDRQV